MFFHQVHTMFIIFILIYIRLRYKFLPLFCMISKYRVRAYQVFRYLFRWYVVFAASHTSNKSKYIQSFTTRIRSILINTTTAFNEYYSKGVYDWAWITLYNISLSTKFIDTTGWVSRHFEYTNIAFLEFSKIYYILRSYFDRTYLKFNFENNRINWYFY